MSEFRAQLDNALLVAGQVCTLRRTFGTTNQVNVDVDVLATVRSPNAEELAAGIDQSHSIVVFSPTPIFEAQWPGGQPSTQIRPEIPRKGDKFKIDGRFRNIEIVNPISPGGELVRIELRVLG